jgi:hypothetical protein
VDLEHSEFLSVRAVHAFLYMNSVTLRVKRFAATVLRRRIFHSRSTRVNFAISYEVRNSEGFNCVESLQS